MTKDNAIPRPYTIRPTSQKGRVILQGGDQNTTNSFSIGLDEDTAKLIVNAVNSHDELIKILKSIKNHPDYSAFHNGLPFEITNNIEQALKNAQGEN